MIRSLGLLLLAAGAAIEGNGVQPVVRFEADHRSGDPTLEEALALLR